MAKPFTLPKDGEKMDAANTSAITVTVHADVYAKIQDESNTDWHALLALAQEKQITFATA